MCNHRSFIIHIFLIITLTACAAPTQKPRAAEEEKIYSLLLDTDPANYLSEASVLVVGDASLPDGIGYGSDVSDLGIFLNQETIADFQLINRESRPMPASLPTNKPYALSNTKELRALPGNGDWPEFDAKFPNTDVVTFFSGIGFDKHLGQALVYMEHYCGGECAKGSLYFLVKINEEWKLERVIELWVS